jgi:hypothetical protein
MALRMARLPKSSWLKSLAIDLEADAWHTRDVASRHTVLTHLNVLTVEGYDNNGKTQKRWTRIGAAFPHKEGLGFNIELKALPMDGRLVVLPPDSDNGRNDKIGRLAILWGPGGAPIPFYAADVASHN